MLGRASLLLAVALVLASCDRSPVRLSPEPAAMTAAASAARAEPSTSASASPPIERAGAAAGPRNPRSVAYAGDRAVCLALVLRDALAAPSCVALGSPVSQMIWRKRGELALLLDDGRAGVLSHGAFTALPAPPPATFRTPKPASVDFPVREGGKSKIVVSEAGSLWLGRCGWTSLLDKPACLAWVFARLGGAKATRRDEPRAAASPYGPAGPPAGPHVGVFHPPTSAVSASASFGPHDPGS